MMNDQQQQDTEKPACGKSPSTAGLGGMVIEQVREAATPEEMRVEIFRLLRYDALVRSVMYSADYKGLSGEDRYTILAYYALRERAKYQQSTLDFVMTKPPAPMVVTPNLK